MPAPASIAIVMKANTASDAGRVLTSSAAASVVRATALPLMRSFGTRADRSSSSDAVTHTDAAISKPIGFAAVAKKTVAGVIARISPQSPNVERVARRIATNADASNAAQMTRTHTRAAYIAASGSSTSDGQPMSR